MTTRNSQNTGATAGTQEKKPSVLVELARFQNKRRVVEQSVINCSSTRKALVMKLEDGKVAVVFERRTSAKSKGWQFTKLVKSKHHYSKTIQLIRKRAADAAAKKMLVEGGGTCG